MELRFSISRLMVLVLLIAVGIAAAMAGAVPFTLVTLSEMTLGALLSRGPRQAFFVGCSVFGWAFMFLAFAMGPDVRYSLPTIRPIVHIYEAIHGPVPATFKSPEEASRVMFQVVEGVHRAITIGHSLIALTLALAGGVVAFLIVGRRKS